MEDFKMKKLLARRDTTICLDEFELARRIKSEHLFTSVDEALGYMKTIINNRPINKDDPFFTSYKDSPVLVANVMDEAVCSIISELFMQDFRLDADALGYYSVQISNFNDMLLNLKPEKRKEYPFLPELFTLMDSIYYLAFPIHHKEENPFGKLSTDYYTLMAMIYGSAKPLDNYFLKYYNYYISKIVGKGRKSHVH